MQITTKGLARGVTAAMVSALLLIGVNVAAAPAASASGCAGPFCGGITNDTDYTMHYTEALRDDHGPHRCDVWNWDGGNDAKWLHAYCVQATIGGNSSRGGFGSGHDVDAFTFVGRGYHVRWGILGTWSWHKEGVWTKISTAEYATCDTRDDNAVWCTVS